MKSLPIVLAGILVGLTMGVGLYTFVYARGYAYVRSPLLNVNRACHTCHRWPEQELKDRVEKIQTRFFDTRNIALNALLDLIHDIRDAKAAGASDQELADARNLQRKAQFYIEVLVSENWTGFHADQYSVKLLAEAINFCREGQLALRTKVSVVAAAKH